MKYKKIAITLFFVFSNILICSASEFVPFGDLEAPRTNSFLKRNGVDFSIDLLRSENGSLSRGLARSLRSDARSTLSDSNRASLVEYISFTLTFEDPGVWQPALKFLSRLQRNDFSKFSRQIISEAEGNDYFEINIPRVYGAAGINYSQLRGNIEDVGEDFEINRENHPLEWNSLLALAKNGDSESIEKVLGYVRSLPEGTYYLGSPLFLSDLPYVSQPEVVDLLVEFLYDDTVYDGADDVMAVRAASFAAGALSRILVGFPSSGVERRILTTEDLEEIREWIDQYSGPWEIIDYRDELRPDSFILEGENQKTGSFGSTAVDRDALGKKRVEGEREKGDSSSLKNSKNSDAESTYEWWPWLIAGLILFGGLVLLLRQKSHQRGR